LAGSYFDADQLIHLLANGIAPKLTAWALLLVNGFYCMVDYLFCSFVLKWRN
jgi:hypothetical protein